ncbi:leupaxin isoform x2 [Limosa lapponica baueri]|uniref:Leupaxin isoform x2 n=1 Tax=Limosa lapponica baueri TaxID=1758121 RepID=A0A2I0TWT8_LIMLA|nr:leupaxin isoform x2 [Limosa lapponica baueri]
MAGGGASRGHTHCPCGRRISVTDEHDRCVLCLGASHDPQGCGACAAMAPYAARLRWERLRALLQARPGGGTDLRPERVSCGAAKGKSTKRRHELAFPASRQGSVPALQPAALLCLPAEPGRAALPKDLLLSPPQTESPPQSKTFVVPDNTHSLQKKHCHVRTKQNPKASSPRMLKASPSSSFVSRPPLHPLHSVSGPEPQSGGSPWLGMLSDLARSILLIAEAALRPREPPPELATDPSVSSSAAGVLLEPGMSSGSQELAVSLGEAVTSSRMSPLPTISEQPLLSPRDRVSPHPTVSTGSCDSSSWTPGVAFGVEDCCYDSSGEDDLADLIYHFRTEEQESNTFTSENASFPEFLKRLAKLVGFHLIPFRESTGCLTDQYLDRKPSCDRVAVPVHPVLDKLVKNVWQTPHTIPPVSKEIERKYLLPEDAVGYISQPAHRSVVVEAAMAREKEGQDHNTAPQNPELRCLDSFGQRVCQSAAAALRVVDYQVYMARGQAELWKRVFALAKHLPQDQRQAFQAVVLQGIDLARHQVRAALDAGDTVARAAASGVDARRSAWLQASSFHKEVQTKLENLPYTGENLFGEQVEAALQRARERQAMLHFLRSAYCPSAPHSGAGKGKAPLHALLAELEQSSCPASKDPVPRTPNSCKRDSATAVPPAPRGHEPLASAAMKLGARELAEPSPSLDNMLGSLTRDLQELGITATPTGVCAACRKPIAGKVLTALGKTWHPEHFVCARCGQELGGRPFFERGGRAYCEEDYHQAFSPRCAYCAGPIREKVLTALDQTWHPEHFFCAHCGKVFGDDGFHERSGKPYCRQDFLAMFAPKCQGCERPVTDNYLSALQGVWHPECFVCAECLSSFGSGSFFELEGRPYCELHFHQRQGSICHGCGHPVTGRCITAAGRKYHPEHFICAYCLGQLQKGTFREHGEKMYCQVCYDKLFL